MKHANHPLLIPYRILSMVNKHLIIQNHAFNKTYFFLLTAGRDELQYLPCRAKALQ